MRQTIFSGTHHTGFCTDWEKYKDRNGRMRNDQDELKISIALNTYVNWVNEAYK